MFHYAGFLAPHDFSFQVLQRVEAFGNAIVRIKARGDNAFKCNLAALLEHAEALSEEFVRHRVFDVDAVMTEACPSHNAGIRFCGASGVWPAFMEGVFDSVFFLEGHKVMVALKRQVGTSNNTDVPGIVAYPTEAAHYLWPTTWAQIRPALPDAKFRLHADVTPAFRTEAVPLLFSLATMLAHEADAHARCLLLNEQLAKYQSTIRESKEKHTSDTELARRIQAGTSRCYTLNGGGAWNTLFVMPPCTAMQMGIALPPPLGTTRIMIKRRKQIADKMEEMFEKL